MALALRHARPFSKHTGIAIAIISQYDTFYCYYHGQYDVTQADSTKGKIAALLGLEGVHTMTAVAASVQGCGLITEQMKINQNLCVKYTMEVANKF